MYLCLSASVCVFVCISQMQSEHFRRYQRFSAFFYMFFVCYMRLTQLCPNVDRIKAQSQLQSQSLLSPLHSHSCSCSCCCTVAHSPCLTLLRFVVFTAVRTHKKEKLLQRICHQKMQEEEAEEVCLAWRSFMCNCVCVCVCICVCLLATAIKLKPVLFLSIHRRVACCKLLPLLVLLPYCCCCRCRRCCCT